MPIHIQKALDWFQQGRPVETKETICSSRDIFQGRLDHMLRWLLKNPHPDTTTTLFTAILGELGNNCFDHNLGQWQDIAGCWFEYHVEANNLWSLVADRGQGVFSSLSQVLPTIQDDEAALEIAFHKKISGRSPEKRGNGLKFVRSVINGDEKRGLFFASGKALRIFGGLEKELKKIIETISQKIAGKGTFAFVLFKVT